MSISFYQLNWARDREQVLDQLQQDLQFMNKSMALLSEEAIRKFLGIGTTKIHWESVMIGLINLKYHSYALSMYRISFAFFPHTPKQIATAALRAFVEGLEKTREVESLFLEIPASDLTSLEIIESTQLFKQEGILPQRLYVDGSYVSELQFAYRREVL